MTKPIKPKSFDYKKTLWNGIARNTPIKRSGRPIRRVSKSKAARNAIYSKLRKKYLEWHPMCELCKVGTAQDIHHKRGQGIYQNEVKYFMAVCRACHSFLEKNRDWARERGYLLDRIGKL